MYEKNNQISSNIVNLVHINIIISFFNKINFFFMTFFICLIFQLDKIK